MQEKWSELILGKWEIIAIGNWPKMDYEKPTGYTEFLKDSTMIEYEYSTGFTTLRKYWIDSLLNESLTREDGFTFIFQYHYKFKDENTLQTDQKDFLGLFLTALLKRKN